MHHEFNAFLLLTFICVGSFSATLPLKEASASSTVNLGIRLWNFNTTHVVPNANVQLYNKTSLQGNMATNETGWANITAPNLGNFTLQVRLENIVVYNATVNLNQTTVFKNLTSTNITDYAFTFTDRLFRPVQNGQVDLRVNSSIIATAVSLANGTATVRNLPFHNYNTTLSREQVFISNSTLRLNATTYAQKTAFSFPTINYTLTVRDHTGVNIVHVGTVSLFDYGVPANNATNTLNPENMFWNLWPGKYWVLVTGSNATIWQSLEILSSNTTQSVNAYFGYTITFHILDSLSRPLSSVSVNLVQNGIVTATEKTDDVGTVTFSNLPQSSFELNFTVLGRVYVASADVNVSSIDLSFKLDDVIVLAGVPFNTAPLTATFTLIVSVTAVLGTVLLYRRRKRMVETTVAKEKDRS